MPLMLGWVATSVLAGQLVSRTGRYKIYPIIGSAITAVGFYLLTRLTASSTSTTAIIDMIVIGMGMGFVFQVYLVAMQNSVRAEQMGIATATVQFFRSIGATFGVAAFGTVLFNNLRGELASRIGSAANGLDFESIVNSPRRLPPALAHDLKFGLAASLHSVFIDAFVVVLIAGLLSLLLKEIPLRTTSNVSAALSSEIGPVAEDGAQEAAEATHQTIPSIRSGT
jgi:MFS family permease